MRKVILQEFISLDSLAAGPNDSVDYVPASTQGDKSFGEEQFKLMNRRDFMPSSAPRTNCQNLVRSAD